MLISSRISQQVYLKMFRLTSLLSSQTSNPSPSLLLKLIAPFASTPLPHQLGSFQYPIRHWQKTPISPEQLQTELNSIYEWALGKGAQRYSFLTFPHTNGISEKHQCLQALKLTLANPTELPLSAKDILRGEGDGSSYPSGGLRKTHEARAYLFRDLRSHLYLRPSTKTLYIPALLLSHHGQALDTKTLLRNTTNALENATIELLKKIGINTDKTTMLVGLEQQFFVVPKSAYNRREDLRWTGRALVGSVPVRNQQLGEHYYAKMPPIVQSALSELQQQLLAMGIPLKTRHNEVALNQFEVACIHTEAGTALDQNILITTIMQQIFDKHGLTVLFHEKPFKQINGSGKHANFSINYQKPNGDLKNLFSCKPQDSPLDIQTHKLFILLQLSALLKHHKLYLASIASPGNELRLGGHQAPPRILSAALGPALANLLDQLPSIPINNLSLSNPALLFDTPQQNTDRNRTCPFAYTGNRFEFRSPGAPQNTALPLSVIAATLASEIQLAISQLEKGHSLQKIIQKLLTETQKIRFEGDGYSSHWKEQATKRGLYVNHQFTELYNLLESEQQIFAQIKTSSKQENESRAAVAKNHYIQTAIIEANTLINIARKHIIPHALAYLQTFTGQTQIPAVNGYYKTVSKKVEKVIEEVNKLQEKSKSTKEDLQECQILRNQLQTVSDIVTELIDFLPKNDNFPDQSQFLNL